MVPGSPTFLAGTCATSWSGVGVAGAGGGARSLLRGSRNQMIGRPPSHPYGGLVTETMTTKLSGSRAAGETGRELPEEGGLRAQSWI